MIFQELEHLIGQVWIYPASPEPQDIQPNVGILRLPNRTILIDGGNSPRHSRRILGELAASGFPPVDTIIYTHHHWDHVFGAQVFNAATIIAHENCAARLQEAAIRPWSQTALRDEMARQPELTLFNEAIIRVVEDFRDFRICVPTMSFSHLLTLHTAMCRVELVHVGGSHASDSIIVKIPEFGVMFLGDSYYPPMYLERTPENDKLDVTVLESCAAEGYEVYVDGHGKPRTLARLQAMIAEERQRQGI